MLEVDVAFEPPPPGQVLDDLNGLTPALYRALEAGTAAAREFFALRNEHVERFQFASTTRYVAKQILDSERLAVDFEPEDLANNGLYLTYRGYPIRIRRLYRNGPPPASSRALHEFHAQTLCLLGINERPNLLVLWDTGPSNSLGEYLYLACPRANDVIYPSVPSCFWNVRMPNPAFAIAPPPLAPDDMPDDLDIRRPPLQDTGSGEAR